MSFFKEFFKGGHQPAKVKHRGPPINKIPPCPPVPPSSERNEIECLPFKKGIVVMFNSGGQHMTVQCIYEGEIVAVRYVNGNGDTCSAEIPTYMLTIVEEKSRSPQQD